MSTSPHRTGREAERLRTESHSPRTSSRSTHTQTLPAHKHNTKTTVRRQQGTWERCCFVHTRVFFFYLSLEDEVRIFLQVWRTQPVCLLSCEACNERETFSSGNVLCFCVNPNLTLASETQTAPARNQCTVRLFFSCDILWIYVCFLARNSVPFVEFRNLNELETHSCHKTDNIY